MDITLNIVLEVFGLSAQGELGAREFSRTMLVLPEEETADFHTLYISHRATAFARCAADPNVIFLCPDDGEAQKTLPNLYVVPGEADEVRLLRRVQDVFFKIGEWNKAMHISLIRQHSLQKLMTLSEPILKNSIHITDSAFTLVACTRGIEPLDPTIARLRARGSHDSKFVERLGGTKSAAAWTKYSEIGMVNYPQVSPYNMVYKVHRFQYTYYNHTVMVCDHVPYSPGIRDLFAMLVENLSVAIEANWNRERAQQQAHSSIISALLDADCDGESLEVLATQTGLPLLGSYVFLKFRSLDGLPMVRMLRELSELLPSALVTEYHGAPTALLYSASAKPPLDEDTVKRLTQFLQRYGLTCSASEPYSELRRTATAFRQTGMVLRVHGSSGFALLGPAAPTLGSPGCILDYSKNSVYYLLGNLSDADRALWRASRYGCIVAELMQSDKLRETRSLMILFTYLNCDRNATVASKLLHMHRNNVIYHVEKLQDRFGIVLADPLIHYQLLTACIVLASSTASEEKD